MNLKNIRLINLLWLIENNYKNKQIDFCKATGIKSSEISQMKNPNNKRNMGDEVAALIEKKLGLPAEWMSQEHNFDRISEANVSYMMPKLGIVDMWDIKTPLSAQEVEVPYYMEVELAAGNGFETSNEDGSPKLRFNKSYLDRMGVDPSMAACVRVSGNSMEPKLSDGDVIAIDTARTSIVDGDTYAINHDGLLRVKRLYRLPGNKVRINSFNSAEHPDEIIKLDDTGFFKIIGRVFHSVSDW